jgi:hypothetical protein
MSRTIGFAKDKFNFLNRLNHRHDIGQLNIGAKKNNLYSNSLLTWWKDWKPECDYYCCQCVPEIVKTKLYNCNPIRDTLKKIICNYCNNYR